VPNLLSLFDEFGVKATFLFSLGPDYTAGHQAHFPPGSSQGIADERGQRLRHTHPSEWRLAPRPHVGRRNEGVMRESGTGPRTGHPLLRPHTLQDGLVNMSENEVRKSSEGRKEFERIFGEPPGQQAQQAGRPTR